MGNEVYANGREVSCKAAAGKSICAFPDVCLSPPSPPAGPIPIPYPNTAMSSDTSDGSKNVKISGKEVMLKNSSAFKKSSGDEAATKSFGMNVISHQIQGKVAFVAWSMDVKIEGENAVRHLDMTTGNQQSNPPGVPPPWPYQDQMTIWNIKECEKDVERFHTDCAGQKPGKCTAKCKKAQKCILQPKNKDKEFCCDPDTTGHHVVEVHCFTPTSGRGAGERLPGFEDYKDGHAPCTCASESRADGFHGVMHAIQSLFEAAFTATGTVLRSWRGKGKLDRKSGKRGSAKSNWTYGQARDAGAKALKIAAGCNEECIKKQLDAYHTDTCGIDENDPVRSDPDADSRSAGDLTPAQKGQVTKAKNDWGIG